MSEVNQEAVEDAYLSLLDWLWKERGCNNSDRIYAAFSNFLPRLQALATAPLDTPLDAPVGVEAVVKSMRMLAGFGVPVTPECIGQWADQLEALAQQPAIEYERQQPCGCVLCVCEDEKQCHGCGAKHCGNHTDHPAYVTRDLAAEAERKFFSRDYYEEAREGKKPWPGQQPAAEGEEIMVNAAHDVYTLPLQPSGLSSGPRFVVHVPGPEQPAAVDGAMRKVAAVAHSGGLIGLNPYDALTAIRRLSLPYWRKEEKPEQVRATLAAQPGGEG